MSLSSMYHFSTSVISGGLLFANSHPSTAYSTQDQVAGYEAQQTDLQTAGCEKVFAEQQHAGPR